MGGGDACSMCGAIMIMCIRTTHAPTPPPPSSVSHASVLSIAQRFRLVVGVEGPAARRFKMSACT